MEYMPFSLGDGLVFLVFFAVVVLFSMFKSRKKKSTADYFLAGRRLTWPMIGLSMIAANISSEQFVGMSGQAAGLAGLAVASYEWIAAVTMVLVALFFLPKILKSGIYTFPEFLEYRYSSTARHLMAFYTTIIYVFVLAAAVLYSGGLVISTLFQGIQPFGIEITLGRSIWIIGIVAGIYIIWGGLEGIAFADLFFGSSLIFGGIATLIIGLGKVGGVNNFMQVNADSLHMILPGDNAVLPWTSLVFALWIANFYYWSVNQFVTQKTLAAKSLKEGQLGVIFASALKLITPFIIVIPGIISFQLFKEQMVGPGATTDVAFPLLVRNILPAGLKGFVFAAISGAVVSSLASMLNSASTIFTMDIYRELISKDKCEKKTVIVGRMATGFFLLIACLIAPALDHPALKGIFSYIQEFQGFISPGILAAFVFGFAVPKAPKNAGILALAINPVIYGILWVFFGQLPIFENVNIFEVSFLDRIGVTFILIIIIMGIVTLVNPLDKPVAIPEVKGFDSSANLSIKCMGLLVVIAVIALFIIFW